jgi:taurine dioxygenase
VSSITVKQLREDLQFGALIEGIDWHHLEDEAVRQQLSDMFLDRGMILFRGGETSAEFQVALSKMFGPIKDHPTKTVSRNDEVGVEGIIDLHYKPKDTNLDLLEIDGRKVASWIPWHFDHAYNDELNRAGVLRMLVKARHGGMTGFTDGIDLYNKFDPELRARIEGKNIIYTLDVRWTHQRFIPKVKSFGMGEVNMSIVEESRRFPRAIHPAVWTRHTGEKVLHVSPWVAAGIEGMENEEGDALLRSVCDEIEEDNGSCYWHDWQVHDMLIWDNWRFLHAVQGADPNSERHITRTTIAGDYGLGRFEGGKKIGEVNRELADL